MRKAVFTIAQDEPVFLPVWLRHYSKFFEPHDIHIINHQSTPENYTKLKSLQQKYGFVIQNVFNDTSFDHEWLCKVVADYQRWLLHCYECVLFCETDEIVIPKDGDLIGYIENMERSCVTTNGWEIVQRKNEPIWIQDQPIIHNQRSYWKKWPPCDKPLLSKRSLEWAIGFHTAKELIDGQHYIELKVPQDNNLLLLHLHRVDFEYAFEKVKINSKKNWSKEAVEKNQGTHNRLMAFEEEKTPEFELRHMKSWYYRDSRLWEPIPKELAGLI